MLRTLIVDDEPLARQRILGLLQEHADVQVIGECADGRAAAEQIAADRPDLVFLDIHMPELDGFGVVQALQVTPPPSIVFVTAWDEHAVRAFEVNALDYILKPFDADRLAVAVQRARDRAASAPADEGDVERRLLAALERVRTPGYARRLVIRNEQRLELLDVSRIDWIEAAGKYVRLHAGGLEHLLREPLHHLEGRLDPEQFARIHRSTIVNLDVVESLEPLFHGEYRVCLRGGTTLTLSRSYRTRLRERFGKSL